MSTPSVDAHGDCQTCGHPHFRAPCNEGMEHAPWCELVRYLNKSRNGHWNWGYAREREALRFGR
jgi:hypothetical protein